MQLHPFGARSGISIPPVNIGGMRLAQITDMDEAVRLIRHAIDSGMRYIDTSRGYGDSEIKIGKALKDGYREKVILSTKWSPWITKIEPSDDTSADCIRKRIEESMRRLDVDYLDFYQIWNIESRPHFEQATAKGGMLDGILKAMDEGLVGHTGFTTHDSVENLLSYMDRIPWCEIILFTHNILNPTYAPVIAAAHARGIGTVIMNPIAGGMLNQHSAVLEDLADSVGAASVPALGIRWLLSNPAINGIISGINRMSDVDSSVAAGESGPFTAAEMERINARLAEILAGRQAFCTGCKYCLPCPQGIEIPQVMRLIADQRFWGFEEHARKGYQEMLAKTAGADACAQCGNCEEKCTQHLQIMAEMRYAADTFAGR